MVPVEGDRERKGLKQKQNEEEEGESKQGALPSRVRTPNP